jgi:hypothetical protein
MPVARTKLNPAVVMLGVALIAAGTIGLLLVGCGPADEQPSREQPSAEQNDASGSDSVNSSGSAITAEPGAARQLDDGTWVYTSRAQVAQLPVSVTTDFQMRHEPIPEFRDRDGNVIGMNAMVMLFPVADGVSIEPLQVGDFVLFEMRVDWDDQPAWALTAWERLPDDTELVWTIPADTDDDGAD